MIPTLMRAGSTHTWTLTVPGWASARQLTLAFDACGDAPMQVLGFAFLDAQRHLLHEVLPRRSCVRARRAGGWLPLVGAEAIARAVLGRLHSFYLDLPPACAHGGTVCVRVTNHGGAALALGTLRANASALDPRRMLANTHALEGYASAISVHAGASVALCVHAPLGRFALRVLRFGAAIDCLLAVDDIAGAPQAYPADAFAAGAGWQASYELATDAAWPGGLYAARLSDASGARFDITFIVKPAVGAAPAALAVLASTNTWQAYNRWAGASLYDYDIDDGLGRNDVYVLHTARPNPAASMADSAGHLAGAERHVLAWLEREGIAYDLFADADLHAAPALLASYRALALNTHCEYWSAPMIDGLETFLAGGGNLAYLAGNGLYWKTVLSGARIEVHHDGSAHTLVDEAGGRWRDNGRPEARLLGVRFTRAGYMTPFRPYRVLAPGHWVFDGTGLRRGALLGRPGASGWELDKIDARARPAGLVHLAKGRNSARSGADMCYFTHAGGGGVFAAGSITFGRCLADDPQLARTLRNVMTRFVGAPT